MYTDTDTHTPPPPKTTPCFTTLLV